MDGVLIIDKPAGMTSHDVVDRVRKILHTRRVGHTGTLDPFATGVLVLLVGKATRLAQFLGNDEKEYDAVVRFGFETDTGDATGKVRDAEGETRNEDVAGLLASTEWGAVLEKFRGEVVQIPPMYSAKKVAGKKLYEHARRGVEVERTPVKVIISTLDMIESSFDISDCEVRLRVVCSAGTYIRTLAESIGRELRIGAHLAELRRTRAGRFDISQAVTLEALERHEDPRSALFRLERIVEHLPSVNLNQERSESTKHGLSTRMHDASFSHGDIVRMLDENRSLIAVGVYDDAEKSLRPKIVLV